MRVAPNAHDVGGGVLGVRAGFAFRFERAAPVVKHPHHSNLAALLTHALTASVAAARATLAAAARAIN